MCVCSYWSIQYTILPYRSKRCNGSPMPPRTHMINLLISLYILIHDPPLIFPNLISLLCNLSLDPTGRRTSKSLICVGVPHTFVKALPKHIFRFSKILYLGRITILLSEC